MWRILAVLLFAIPAQAQVLLGSPPPAFMGGVPIWGPYTVSYGAVSALSLGVAQPAVTISVPGVTTNNLLEPMLPGGSATTIIPTKAIVTAADTVAITYVVNSTVAIGAGSIQVLLAQVR